MTTGRALVASALTLFLCTTAAACDSGSGSWTDATTVQTASASTDPFVGTWTIESETFPSGREYTRAELEAVNAVITLEVRDDGTFVLSDGDRLTEDAWEATGDSTATFWADNTPAKVTMDGGRLTLDITDGPVMTFARS